GVQTCALPICALNALIELFALGERSDFCCARIGGVGREELFIGRRIGGDSQVAFDLGAYRVINKPFAVQESAELRSRAFCVFRASPPQSGARAARWSPRRCRRSSTCSAHGTDAGVLVRRAPRRTSVRE